MYHTTASFSTARSKPVVAQFTGGKLTSDAGALLLKLADKKLRLSERINSLIHDPRDQRYIAHQQQHLLAQRLYALCLGYEDVNDQTELRKDPALLVAVKNTTDEELPLGSASTMTRLENWITSKELSNLTKLFVECFIESYTDTS